MNAPWISEVRQTNASAVCSETLGCASTPTAEECQVLAAFWSCAAGSQPASRRAQREELARNTGDSAALCVLDGTDIVYVART
jgi:hypothetical protein